MYLSTLSLPSDTLDNRSTIWLLGIELRTSGRAVIALNYLVILAISPAPLSPSPPPFFLRQGFSVWLWLSWNSL